jgi:hypothetical protein
MGGALPPRPAPKYGYRFPLRLPQQGAKLGKTLGMLAKLKTYSLEGIEAIPVDVEVDLSPSPLPKTVLVGLPEQAVRESTHRVERAMVNAGFIRPHDRVVINLAPACFLLDSGPKPRQLQGRFQPSLSTTWVD